MSSKVYLCEEIETNQQVAVKIFKESFIACKDSRNSSHAFFVNEVTILKNLHHSSIVGLLDYGQNGTMVHSDNHLQEGLTYIVMEYAPYNLLDFCKTMGPLGEKGG